MDAKRRLLLAVAAIMLVVCIVPNALIDVKGDFRQEVKDSLQHGLQWTRMHLGKVHL